jgi:HEAT repeat protein
MALKKSSSGHALRQTETREHDRDAAGLIARLGDIDASVRRRAARDLAAEPRAAAALCARLSVETDASVRAVLFSSAALLGGTLVVEALVLLLRSEDPGLRNGAIEVLAGLPDAVAPYIEQLLHDSEGDVRIFTVNLLFELHHPKVTQWLSQVLLQDPAVNVVGAALDVLAEIGSIESLPAVRAAAKRFVDDAYIGFAAGVAIERIGTP